MNREDERAEWNHRYAVFNEATQLYSGPNYDEKGEAARYSLMAMDPMVVMREGLRTLQNDHSWHLMVVLTRVSLHNPVKPEHRGFVRKMVDDWLDWGRRRGIPFDEEEIIPTIWDGIPIATDDYP